MVHSTAAQCLKPFKPVYQVPNHIIGSEERVSLHSIGTADLYKSESHIHVYLMCILRPVRKLCEVMHSNNLCNDVSKDVGSKHLRL